MMHCPKGHGLLERAGVAGAFVFACRQCAGRAVTMAVLRRQVEPSSARELWRQAATSRAPGVPCPACLQSTAAILLITADERAELDVCQRCACVWFDAGERERIRDLAPPPVPPDPSPSVLAARQQYAIAEVRLMARRARERTEQEPSFELSRLPALLGLPVELRPSGFTALPLLTWATAVAIVIVSIAGFLDETIVEGFALVPARLGESFGVTMLTAFFVHAGWLHLLGNLWFLLAFGDDVEQRFGRPRWVAIVISATVAGALAHVLLDPRSEVPCVGASGGISGLIVCYALAAPNTRLGTWFWVGYQPLWLTFRARTGLIVWLLIQVWLLVKQLMGTGNVSATAHLGGVAAGVVGWWYWRRELAPSDPPDAAVAPEW